MRVRAENTDNAAREASTPITKCVRRARTAKEKLHELNKLGSVRGTAKAVGAHTCHIRTWNKKRDILRLASNKRKRLMEAGRNQASTLLL